jgi:hypothetical protein
VLGGGELHAMAHLYGHGDDGVLGGGSAGDLRGLIDEVLEVGAHLLEARRIHVGEIVGDRIDARLLADHAARGAPKATDHSSCLLGRSAISRRAPSRLSACRAWSPRIGCFSGWPRRRG